MSDDDWENQLDSDNEEQAKKEEEEKKAREAKFEDENQVSVEEAKKKKLEEQKKAEQEAMENARVKSSNKVDLDKLYEERQAKLAGKPVEAKNVDTKGMSSAAKGMILEKQAEEGLADQLFGADEEGATINLSSEKDYLNLAKKVSNHLYKGNAPYHIEKFFKALAAEMPKHCDSKQIKGVADSMQAMYNTKVKEERKLDKNVKKPKAVLKGAGGKGYERNNNAAMVNDIMGADEDGDYGDETAFKRAEEADFDFM